jgi:hypothetical protein
MLATIFFQANRAGGAWAREMTQDLALLCAASSRSGPLASRERAQRLLV